MDQNDTISGQASAAFSDAPQALSGLFQLRGRKVLAVDDDEFVRELLVAYLEAEGYVALPAADGVDALDQVARHSPDLVIIDVHMPKMDGYSAVRALKADPASRNIPVIMVTALSDREARLQGLEAGAEDFLNKPIDAAELTIRVRNLLRLKAHNDFLSAHNRILDLQVRAKTRQVREQCIETVLTLTRAAEFRDEDTGTHVSRISHYSVMLARHMGMDSEFCDRIFYASPMHDIGKLAIPDHVLLKQGGLTPAEWAIMKTHTILGKKILQGNNSPYLDMGGEIAESHHECWDGSGYPYGLQGDAIPLAARIMAICDVYDALRSERPYKPNMSHAAAIEVVTNGDARVRPQQFDPAVLAAFRTCADEFADIYASCLGAGPLG